MMQDIHRVIISYILRILKENPKFVLKEKEIRPTESNDDDDERRDISPGTLETISVNNNRLSDGNQRC